LEKDKNHAGTLGYEFAYEPNHLGYVGRSSVRDMTVHLLSVIPSISKLHQFPLDIMWIIWKFLFLYFWISWKQHE